MNRSDLLFNLSTSYFPEGNSAFCCQSIKNGTRPWSYFDIGQTEYCLNTSKRWQSCEFKRSTARFKALLVYKSSFFWLFLQNVALKLGQTEEGHAQQVQIDGRNFVRSPYDLCANIINNTHTHTLTLRRLQSKSQTLSQKTQTHFR